MDKNMDYNFYGIPPFGGNPTFAGMGYDTSQNNFANDNLESNAMFNPMLQYEQAYMYYRYSGMQMEYKIKCKEYEKLSSKPEFGKEVNRKIE